MSQQSSNHGKLSAVEGKHEAEIVSEWVREQAAVKGRGAPR